MKIVLPDRIDFDQPTLDKLHALGARLYDDSPADEDALIERISEADIIVANFVQVTSRVINAAPKLKYIIVAAAGYDTVDYRYAAQRGIPVLNCPTQNVEAVAEHAVSLMLATAHRIVEAATDLRASKWNGIDLVGTEVSHKKLGLIGYGKIGKLIEQKVSGLAMAITRVDSKSSEAEFDQLLHESDIVCLCLTLNETTRNLMNKQRLSLLKQDAILINVARGGVVDQSALLELLKAGRIRGAGIDVYQDEPGDSEATEAIVELAGLPNVVATPHIAYNTEETIRRLGEELVNNLQSCLQGEPENVVNSAREG
jgi:phosphoglycerate dehydrogenase-like enzyme